MIQADSECISPPIDLSRLQNILEQETARQAALQNLSQLRRQAAAEIDRLISFLDASDPYVQTEQEEAVDDVGCDEDSDIEDGNDEEPSLGWSTTGHHSPMGGLLDGEDEHDGCEPDACDEPSLGWTEAGQIGRPDDDELVDHARRELTKAQTRYKAKRAKLPDGCRLVPRAEEILMHIIEEILHLWANADADTRKAVLEYLRSLPPRRGG